MANFPRLHLGCRRRRRRKPFSTSSFWQPRVLFCHLLTNWPRLWEQRNLRRNDIKLRSFWTLMGCWLRRRSWTKYFREMFTIVITDIPTACVEEPLHSLQAPICLGNNSLQIQLPVIHTSVYLTPSHYLNWGHITRVPAWEVCVTLCLLIGPRGSVVLSLNLCRLQRNGLYNRFPKTEAHGKHGAHQRYAPNTNISPMTWVRGGIRRLITWF